MIFNKPITSRSSAGPLLPGKNSRRILRHPCPLTQAVSRRAPTPATRFRPSARGTLPPPPWPAGPRFARTGLRTQPPENGRQRLALYTGISSDARSPAPSPVPLYAKPRQRPQPPQRDRDRSRHLPLRQQHSPLPSARSRAKQSFEHLRKHPAEQRHVPHQRPAATRSHLTGSWTSQSQDMMKPSVVGVSSSCSESIRCAMPVKPPSRCIL